MIATITELRPTQITVGYREVERKRRRWREQTKSGDWLLRHGHPSPVVLGPCQTLFIIDHHHMLRALYEEGVAEVDVRIVEDLGTLSMAEFWEVCEARGWCHPYDAAGERQPMSAIPATIGDLADDSFRSLAGELRRAGGYSKASTPYSEFKWADFLRDRIDRTAAEADLDGAMELALGLVKTTQAEHLPGWRSTNDQSRSPCAADVPAEVGLPLSIHSNATAIIAPRIGPAM
jgi:hypothetical protein